MEKNGFILTSEECELLVVFESNSSLEKLANAIGRDISNVSRSLSRIATKLPVVEKMSGRWVLTEQGKKLVQQTRDSVQFQRSLFQKQTWLRIGTNREFSARVIGKNLDGIQTLFPDSHLRIMAFESGTEQALLDGLIDIGIDCERPFSPEISFKTSVKESIVVVASPKFKKEHQKEIRDGSFFGLPHLLCDRLAPDRILMKSENPLNTLASFNDIATTRSACQLGMGWALLPRYTVQEELDRGLLVEIESIGGGESTYGVWWLRGRKYLQPIALGVQSWLKKIEI